jgi:hypothetical protein
VERREGVGDVALDERPVDRRACPAATFSEREERDPHEGGRDHPPALFALALRSS